MDREPAVPRPAATVLLVRDAPGLEVFLQRRVAGMAFAGGMTVFPGGGVDAGDVVGADLWIGPGPQWWAHRFGTGPEEAAGLVLAAVRETFEECGVLLADRADGAPAAVDAEARADLVARRRSLGEVLTAAGLRVRADLLVPWARWITPAGSPRRYDTAFFVAAVPAGQEADAHTTEAVEARWWTPVDALVGWRAGEMELMAPTFRTLQEIAVHADTASVLAAAARREIRAVVPRLRREGDEVVVVLPGDPDFGTGAAHLRPGGGA